MDKGKSMKPDYPMGNEETELKVVTDNNKGKNKTNFAPQPPARHVPKDVQSIFSETSDNLNNESFFNANNYILNEVYLNDDLSLLPVVDEKTLVSCVKNKFEAKKYFSYIGELLVSVNPREKLKIFDDDTKKVYSDSIYRSSQDPHLYWTCSETHKAAIINQRDYMILMNGESGSGKTETFKYAIDFFAKTTCKKEKLRNKLLNAQIILEAFGNAPTLYNSNASRFVNLTKLRFNQDGAMESAKISEFMLEKSRVILESPNERNFLIFYYLLAGLDKESMSCLQLKGIQNHRITMIPEGVANHQLKQWAENFKDLKTRMLYFGLKEEELNVAFRMLAAIILLSDVEFQRIENTRNEIIFVKNEAVLVKVAELLCVNPELLTSYLISTQINSSSGVQLWPRSMEEATNHRNSLAKTLYARTFGWIVKSLNNHLDSEDSNTSEGFTISLLDTFGYEDFKHNSVEQLMINTLNEELQNAFYRHSFSYDQQLYQKEGLPYPQVNYKDNSKMVDLLLQKPIGLFNILKEECKSQSNGEDDTVFVQKLNDYFGHNTDYIHFKNKPFNFGLNHYTGKTRYNGEEFLTKSKEFLSKNLIDCLQKSEDIFVSDLLTAMPAPNGSFSNIRVRSSNKKIQSFVLKTEVGGATNEKPVNKSMLIANKIAEKLKNFPTNLVDKNVSNSSNIVHFITSLNEIISIIENVKPVFIKCIKPNENSFSTQFVLSVAVKQIKDNGLVEYARVRRLNFPVKIEFLAFARRFEKLAKSYGKSLENSHPKEICHHVLQHSSLRNYRIGMSRVFIKNEDLDLLERDQKTCIIQEPGNIIGNKKNQVLNIDSNNNNNFGSNVATTNSHGVAFTAVNDNHQHIDYNNNANNLQFNQKATTPHLRSHAKSRAAHAHGPPSKPSSQEPDLL